MREAAARAESQISYERAPALSFRLGTSPNVLSTLQAPDVNLAVWRRGSIPVDLGSLRAWADQPGPAFDAHVEPTTFDSSALVRSMPAQLASWMRADFDTLIRTFSEYVAPGPVRIQFHSTPTDQCRKFHEDNLQYRMITTYFGPGTEYAPESCLDRQALARPFCDFLTANRAIIQDESQLFFARPGDVLLMKGQRTSTRRGAVHRSPPIESLGLRRVVLVLSTVERYGTA